METPPNEPVEIEATTGETSTPETEVYESSFLQDVTGENIQLESSLAINVSAQNDISANDSLVFVARAEKDMEVRDSGAMAMVSGGNFNLTNGGAQSIVVGGNMELTNGGAQVMVVGGNLTAQKSFVAVAVTNNLSLSDDSKVLLDKPKAILFGAALGAVFAVLSWLLKRKN